MTAKHIALTVTLAAALSTSAAFAHKGGKHGTHNRAVDAVKNPYAGDPSAAESGQKLYGKYCAACHGGSAQGVGKNPGLITAAKHDSAGKLFNVITKGVESKGMPSWSQLPDQQRWQIVTYLQTLK